MNVPHSEFANQSPVLPNGYTGLLVVASGLLFEVEANREFHLAMPLLVLVADASKFNQRRMSRIAPYSPIGEVITDRDLPDEVQARVHRGTD